MEAPLGARKERVVWKRLCGRCQVHGSTPFGLVGSGDPSTRRFSPMYQARCLAFGALPRANPSGMVATKDECAASFSCAVKGQCRSIVRCLQGQSFRIDHVPASTLRQPCIPMGPAGLYLLRRSG
jgi:hypothetical protein